MFKERKKTNPKEFGFKDLWEKAAEHGFTFQTHTHSSCKVPNTIFIFILQYWQSWFMWTYSYLDNLWINKIKILILRRMEEREGEDTNFISSSSGPWKLLSTTSWHHTAPAPMPGCSAPKRESLANRARWGHQSTTALGRHLSVLRNIPMPHQRNTCMEAGEHRSRWGRCKWQEFRRMW